MAGAPAGNNNAGKPRLWREAINRALDRRARKRGLRSAMEALDELAEQFLEAVSQGDIAAFRELGDRLEGKAREYVEMEITRHAEEMTDAELADIARRGSARAAEAQGGEEQSPSIH